MAEANRNKPQVILSPEDEKIQRDIILRANRSMLVLNMTLRRRTGRPIGMHLDLRPDEFIQKLSHMR